MQTRGFRAALSALFTLALSLDTLHAVPASFPPQGDDVTPSLGQFRILVAPSFQGMMTGNPNYNSSTHIFTSPLLYDPTTIIGRSSALTNGSSVDALGVPVGSAGTVIGQTNLTVQPGGLEPAGTREVRTEIRKLNMTDFGGSVAAVRAGTNAVGRPNSPGEVQSWFGASGNSSQDFPAQSFFDVFVDVDVPGGGTFPGATNLYNDLPLLVQNTNVTTFPPQVIYVHGMSTAVPIKFNNLNPGVWTNGQIFGLLMLAGHDVIHTNDAATQAAFLSAMNALPNVPVEPQYSSWASGLTLANSNTMIFTNRGDDVTSSLGTFRLAVNPAFQSYMAGYPGWDNTTKRLTSPLLFDPSTTIGRSSPLTNGSPADSSGVLVGSAGTLVASSNLTLLPPLFSGPLGTREVHTEIRSFNLAGGGAAVRAGTAATTVPKSFGEVQSLSGNSGDPYWDFPAKSFFDVFVDVNVPAGGSLPAITLSNSVPLIVQDNNLTAFPPKVIYVHGNSTAVPVLFATNVPAIGAVAGDTFGIILLAGHGVGYNQSNTNDVAQFNQQMSQIPETPVAPQYVTWAPNLKTNPPAASPILLTCSSNITVLATSSTGATVFFTVTASGGCSTPTVAANPPSGSTFPIGTTTVLTTASDTCGNSTNCSFTVTVVRPPISLNCPSNITVTATGPSGAIVFFTVMASGGCSPPPFVSANPPSGSTFPIGTTTVFTTASDSCGTTTNCSFTVTVNPPVYPPIVLNCPSNITVNASSGSGATVFFTVTATGGCSPPPFVSANPPSGSTFPIGTTTVLTTASDSCGQVTNCSFTVTVIRPPISLNCPSNITVTATGPGGSVVYFTATASGGCSPPAITANPPSGSTFPVGTTTVFTTASDTCGTSTNCSFTVTVVKPPISLNCSSNITVTATSSNGIVVFFTVTATGGCSPPPFVSANPPSGSTFPVGTTTVLVTASDSCGTFTNCSFTVHVNPPTYPPIVLNCSTNITVTAAENGGEYVFFDLSASGGCSTPNITSSPASGDFFTVGTNIVNVTASDGCGNSTNCSFTVTVVAPPIVLNCSSNLTVTATTPGGAEVFFDVTASGGCDGSPTVDSYPPSGSFLPYGTTTVSSTASDSCGHTTNCSFTVTVNPPGPIVLNCASNITTTATSSSGATVFYSVTASGGCNTPTVSAYPPSGSTFPIGTTIVSVTASDSCGDSTNCSFAVTVVATPIILTCSSNLTVSATSAGGATVFYAVTASGGCSTPTISAYPPSGSTFPVGATTIFVTASDGCGNSTNCSFVVTVTRQSIVLNCSSNITLSATSSNGATVFYTVTASGGCSTPTIRAFPPSGSTFPIGPTFVMVIAYDSCGNSTNCYFEVNVVRPAIALNCSSNITVNATSSNGATVFYTITASGGCSTPTIRAFPPSGSVFEIGDTHVFTLAYDTCDTSTNCNFTVTVINSNPPASGPRLGIRATGTNHIQLTWPTNSSLTYSIAQMLSLRGTNWVTLSNQPTVVGSSNQLILVLTNSQGFFRLISTATNTPPCLVSLTLTNCNLPESVTLTAPTNSPTVGAGNPVNLSATLNLQAGLVAVVSYYTNSTGYSPNCPDTFVTNLISPTIQSNSWIVDGPGSYTASGSGLNAVFTPVGCGSGTVHFITTWQHVCDPGQSSAFVSVGFTVNCATNCLAAGTSTNCAVAGSMALTNTTGATNFCFNSAVAASVANLVTTNSKVIITTTYTNSAGAVTTNCPPTFVTNSVAPTIVSNWWTVSGPGPYTNAGPGTTANFTPTNGGNGTVRFYLKYANNLPCNTNPVTISTNLDFNVFQITNITVSRIPTNRTRTIVGVGERVLVALAGSPVGNWTWSTSAGSVTPTNNTWGTLLTAPSNAVNATVSINYAGGSCPVQFTVLAPNGVSSAQIESTVAYPMNTAGSGMHLAPVYIGPTTVSFYRVQAIEVGAVSTNATGYFANTNLWPAMYLNHGGYGANAWFQLAQDNSWPTNWDWAQSGTCRQPWSDGSFTWPIPAAWKIGSGPTNSMPGWDQAFAIATNGTVTITKWTHSAARSTNSVYVTH